jgi:O-acetyl-ADP-ribose deacetylase (regulator of RNase III)
LGWDTAGVQTIDAVRGDLTTEHADALVNAANSTLLGGGGVDGALHAAAGPALLEACRLLRRTTHRDGLGVSEAVATAAGLLPATWVIHTVGPNRNRGQSDEHLLARCYTNCLDVAVELGAQRVAFPAVGAGAYGWDPTTAARVAVLAVAGHPRTGIERVRFVLFNAVLADAFAAELDRLS